jgi:hypothetical protein
LVRYISLLCLFYFVDIRCCRASGAEWTTLTQNECDVHSCMRSGHSLSLSLVMNYSLYYYDAISNGKTN